MNYRKKKKQLKKEKDFGWLITIKEDRGVSKMLRNKKRKQRG